MASDLKGKANIVTGANSGSGKAVPLQLTMLSATVVMACRSRERGVQALASQGQNPYPSLNIEFDNLTSGIEHDLA
jgi:NAD(P)-dependent dehydrogenase (short-subunit alcohol dehydrogenase family)